MRRQTIVSPKSFWLRPALCACLLMCVLSAWGQNRITEDGQITSVNRNRTDSTSSNLEVPRGLKVWTVDEMFGDISEAVPDTLPDMYMNSIFTTGLRGEYNTTGNLGAPRQSRLFIDRNNYENFIFDEPFGYFVTPVSNYHFTNTYSPLTNLSLNSCGNRTNGEDHFKANFAVNAGKQLGLGFKFDYLYGRGYYDNNSAALFNYSLHGSYLGERYQAHFLFSTNHQKQAENGGITNDNFITHPEVFSSDFRSNEIPTMLSSNWNRYDNQHIFLSHRYNVGFNRKVPMTEEEIKARKFAIESQKENAALKAKEKARRIAEEAGDYWDEEEYEQQLEMEKRNKPSSEEEVPADTTWTKNEYVPVTSFIHTLKFDNFKRIYQAYSTPTDYYGETYQTIAKLSGDSIYDKTTHFEIKNTFAIALLEGFNKYAKAGLKVFAAHDFCHYILPDSNTWERSFNENSFFLGGQISKTEGNTLHYNATAEIGVLGDDAGELRIHGNADLNIPLLGDTVQLAASGFLLKESPSFYYNHYQSRHFWWNKELDEMTHTRIQGALSSKKTHTRLIVAMDNIKNYAYFGNSYDIKVSNDDRLHVNNTAHVRQYGSNLNVITAQLEQDFKIGPVRLDIVGTYQKSSNEEVLPLPSFNLYANLYMKFKIAKRLKCDLGTDVRYFTKYNAPDYVPGLGQFAVQENKDVRTEIGNYPIVNVYANFHLQHTRFFVMMSHVNCSDGNYFLTPHYPLNERLFRFGVSWNFFN